LGQCRATFAAMQALKENDTHSIVILKRHECGDWGDLTDEDRQLNETAIQPDPEKCSRILSHYRLEDGQRLYVITEWDRSETTILLPSEY